MLGYLSAGHGYAALLAFALHTAPWEHRGAGHFGLLVITPVVITPNKGGAFVKKAGA